MTLDRFLPASQEEVWAAFTRPELLKEWWAPEGIRCGFVSVDLKAGGWFRYCFVGEEDGQEYWGRGTYQEIRKPDLLSYMDTFTDEKGTPVPPSHHGIPINEIKEGIVRFRFSAEKPGTRMVMEMDNYFDESYTKQVIAGWNSMLDNLERML